jgi:hypothetical protein
MLLSKFQPWLEEALESREWERKPNGVAADEARWYEALALYEWLRRTRTNEKALHHATEHWFRWYASEAGNQFRGEIGALFALAIDAGRYEEIVALYGRPLTRPLKPTSATSDAGFGNYLAHRLLESRTLDATDERVFDRFLRASIHDRWLSHGHFQTVAQWLKLRFWSYADPKPEPFSVVRRALDYVPEEARQ